MQEIPELARVFLFVDSVSLLDFARVPIVPTSEDAQPIIGQPAPLFSHVPAELLPLAFEAIPVHVNLLPLLIHAVYEVGSSR
jgi:hypothetical protein